MPCAYTIGEMCKFKCKGTCLALNIHLYFVETESKKINKKCTYYMLHGTSYRSAQAWSMLMGSHWVTCHPHVLYPQGQSQLGNLRPQSSAAVTQCLLIVAHFTDPRMDDSLCQARECHRELNPGRNGWRQRRVCYHTATCSPIETWTAEWPADGRQTIH